MKKLLFVSIFLICASGFAAAQEELSLKRDGGTLYGTLLMPEKAAKPPVVLIIAGSGPTDRNGNQPQMSMNAHKLLAEGLQAEDIASLRFDKRMIGESRWADAREENLVFEDYINDVIALVDMLHSDGRFSDIILAGHSEGSLIAMAAAQNNSNIAKIISITGAGRPFDVILKEQLAAQPIPDNILAEIDTIIESLKRGEKVEKMTSGIGLELLFRPSVQPFVITSMRYIPADLISQLQIPVMVVHGGTDIQIKETDHNMLMAAQPKAVGLFIPDMSHPLKRAATTDQMDQLPTYTNPDLQLHEELIPAMVRFIKK